MSKGDKHMVQTDNFTGPSTGWITLTGEAKDYFYSTKSIPDSDILAQLSKPISSLSRGFPKVSEEPKIFKPLPYTFRIPNTITESCSAKTKVKCPPFYIQLDHALAVIWLLFSKEENEKPLGVVQLQWALHFLKGLQNKNGKYLEDIATCIHTMEDALIEQYAEIPASVKPNNKPPRHITCSSDEVGEDSEDSLLITKKAPFSMNYAEMIKFKPAEQKIFTMEQGVSMNDIDIERQLDKLRQIVTEHISDGALDPGSKENMIETLKAFRRKQINKIQEELKHLHSIETVIGNIDKDNFEPYLNNKQFAILTTRNAKIAQSGSSTSISSKK